MDERHPRHGCGRAGPGECALADIAPDPFERTALAVMRHLFSGFAQPQEHGWLAAAAVAERGYAGRLPGERFFDLVRLVQAMRRSRRSPLPFSNPLCPDCAAVLTEPERHLMLAIQAARRGRSGAARTHAMLLCEGNDTSAVMAALGALPRAQETHAIET